MGWFSDSSLGGMADWLGDKAGGAKDWMAETFGREQGPPADYGPLRDQSQAAGGFADYGQTMSTQSRGRQADLADMLERRARGEDLMSQEMLRQGLQKNLAAQQSMAAGARPGNAAMAARNAAQNAARLGSGLSGQQAMAGIAEQQAAQQALGQHLGQMRGQDIRTALGSRGQAIQGYGDIMRDQTQRAGVAAGTPAWWERALGAVGGAAGINAITGGDSGGGQGGGGS